MTNELSVEEAVELLKEKRMEINYQVNGTTRFSKALDMAIKMLEQQPCEDCISRKEVIRMSFDATIYSEEYGEVDLQVAAVDLIKNMPSVTLQPKRGKWNRVIDKAGHWVWECDKCGWQQRFNTNYCPDCGADMREVNT